MTDKTQPEIVRDLELLGAESISALRKFLAQPGHTSNDVAAARVAASALSAWTRYRQSESAREGNILLLARELATDKKEFEKYIKAAMPNAPMLKALPVRNEA